MNNTAIIELSDSLRLADLAIGAHRVSLSMGDDDPLSLHLPPMQGTSSGYSITPDTLRVMAALYLDAELEQAGIVPAVEAIVAERAGLNIMSMQVADRLEQFAHHQQNWYDRAARAIVYARLFGIGAAATNAEGGTINRDFEHRMAVLALALVRFNDDYRYSSAPSGGRLMQIGQAEMDVLNSLSLRQFGNTLMAARQFHDQLQAAIVILRDPAMEQAFGVQGMWNVLQHVLGDQAPDIGRLVTRGQSGQQMILWLATVSASAGDPRSAQSLPPNAPVIQYAQQWLTANGLDPSEGTPAGGAAPADPAYAQYGAPPAYGR